MSDYVKTLRDSRLRAWNSAKEVAERAAVENRAMSGDEERQWDAWNAEIAAYDKRIQDTIAGEKRALDTETAFAAIRGNAETSAVDTNRRNFADELRGFLTGAKPGNAANGKAFDLSLTPAIEKRWVGEGAGGGSVPVPTTFVGQLYNYLVDTSSMRRANPTVYSSSSGEPIQVPRSTAEGAATWVAEQGTLGASDPTISSVTLSSYKLGKLIQVSTELVQDTGFDLLGFVAQHAGRNIAIAADTAYIVGTGSGQPTGLMGAATVGFTQVAGNTTALTTANSGDSLYEMVHSVIPQYRPNASWLMNDQLLKRARQLKDTQGRYLWEPSLKAGQPDTLLGFPVYVDPNVASPVGLNNLVAAFGDFRGYFIREVTPIRFERSDDFAFGTDLVSFRVVYRTDGKLGDTNAIKTLKNSAT